jgi:hypothetical protein
MPDQESPGADQIREQLRAILASPTFHGSRRCQQFLEYVCEKTLHGDGATLKERTIATEVFGRQPQSDLGEDTIVRVGAREVRKRLAQYYVSPNGAAARIRINLPPGAYVPEFRYAETREHKELPPATGPVPAPRQGRKIGILLVLAAAGLLLAVPAAIQWISADPSAELFEQFWGPVFQSNEPLLLAVGHPLVYHPSIRAQKMNEERLPPAPFPMQRPLELPANELNGSDLIPVPNQYVGFGDMVAATEVASMLGRQSRQVRVRLGSGVDFAELRQSPVLLIGAITNRWTMQLGQNWRFQFGRMADRRNSIIDTQQPGRAWSLPARDDGLAQEDYILISRIRNSPSGKLILLAAGIKQFGTEAAGRLLADPAKLGAMLANAPAEWETSNLQVVLRARVIGNAPAEPEVVASHVW